MKRLIALALLLGSVQAAAQTVSVADGKWGHLPELKRMGSADVTTNAVVRIHQIISERECSLPGQSKKKLDMVVPFAVRYHPDGTPDQIILQRLGCESIEGILGGQILALVQSGEFRSTGTNDEGWYRGVISFSST